MLLFDQNISFRIKKLIEASFPNVKHITDFGGASKSDKEIWEIAKKQNLVIVTFDADFYDFSVIWGHPPKIIWIRSMYQTTPTVSGLLLKYELNIKDFLKDEMMACLEIIHEE